MNSLQKIKSWEEALESENWVAPLVDIEESVKDYIIICQLPGVSKNNMKIKIEDGHLVIMGRIDYEWRKNKKYAHRESELSNFYRKFKLTDGIDGDSDSIEAELENGILSIKLPKKGKTQKRIIEIK